VNPQWQTLSQLRGSLLNVVEKTHDYSGILVALKAFRHHNHLQEYLCKLTSISVVTGQMKWGEFIIATYIVLSLNYVFNVNMLIVSTIFILQMLAFLPFSSWVA